MPVQPLEGCRIAAERFQHIVNLAFHSARLSRQQDPPGFLEELLGEAQAQRASPIVAGGVPHGHPEA